MNHAEDLYLTFRIARDEYAVPLLMMREIVRFRPLTRIPKTPAYIRGVFNLIGRTIPVIDLAIRFGFGPTPIHARSCVVVTEIDLDGERTLLGVLAEDIGAVVELPPNAIEPPPLGMPIRIEYVAGVAHRCHRGEGTSASAILGVEELSECGGSPPAFTSKDEAAARRRNPKAACAVENGGARASGEGHDLLLLLDVQHIVSSLEVFGFQQLAAAGMP